MERLRLYTHTIERHVDRQTARSLARGRDAETLGFLPFHVD